MLGQISGGFLSTVAGFLSWVAREHCMRNPEAVCKAWESLTPEPLSQMLVKCFQLRALTFPLLRFGISLAIRKHCFWREEPQAAWHT